MVSVGNLPAATIANFSSATNDRFTNAPTFVGAGYDWSGVGRTEGVGLDNWVTLIGDSYFISANHFAPSIGEVIYFEDVDNNTTFHYTVSGGSQIGSTDLWVGYTTLSIDSSLARYSLSPSSASELSDTGLIGETLFMSGAGASAGAYFQHVVGQNEAESWLAGSSNSFQAPEQVITISNPVGWDQLVLFNNEPGDTSNNYYNYETQLASGDSGSPLFSTNSGELILQGIAYAVSNDIPANFVDTAGGYPTPDTPEERDATFYTYVGSYNTEINTYITTIPAGIPEPSAFFLIGIAGLPLLRRNRNLAGRYNCFAEV